MAELKYILTAKHKHKESLDKSNQKPSFILIYEDWTFQE